MSQARTSTGCPPRELERSVTYALWRELSEIVMTRIVLFNKRRGGEVAQLLLSSYETRPNWSELANREIVDSLHPMERNVDRQAVTI